MNPVSLFGGAPLLVPVLLLLLCLLLWKLVKFVMRLVMIGVLCVVGYVGYQAYAQAAQINDAVQKTVAATSLSPQSIAHNPRALLVPINALLKQNNIDPSKIRLSLTCVNQTEQVRVADGDPAFLFGLAQTQSFDVSLPRQYTCSS